jgi:Domain of unknown function (DUF4281)
MMNLDVLFNTSNLFVLPFWTLMILLPNWGVTRKVMGSMLPFVPLAGLYVYLFVNSLDPDSAAAFANPQLSDLARLFADDRVMATGWVHFLVMDLFVGRWIYWEGQRTGVWSFCRSDRAAVPHSNPVDHPGIGGAIGRSFCF